MSLSLEGNLFFNNLSQNAHLRIYCLDKYVDSTYYDVNYYDLR